MLRVQTLFWKFASLPDPSGLPRLRTVIPDLGHRLHPHSNVWLPYIEGQILPFIQPTDPEASTDWRKFFFRKELSAVGICIPTLSSYGGPALASPGQGFSHLGPLLAS